MMSTTQKDIYKAVFNYRGFVLGENYFNNYVNLAWYCGRCQKKARFSVSNKSKSMVYLNCWNQQCKREKICFNMSFYTGYVRKVADDKFASNVAKVGDQAKNPYIK